MSVRLDGKMVNVADLMRIVGCELGVEFELDTSELLRWSDVNSYLGAW